MNLHAGTLAAGIAMQTAAVAPAMLAPIEPTQEQAAMSAEGDGGRFRLVPSSAAAPPDAAAIATVQLALGLASD